MHFVVFRLFAYQFVSLVSNSLQQQFRVIRWSAHHLESFSSEAQTCFEGFGKRLGCASLEKLGAFFQIPSSCDDRYLG